MTSAFSRNLVVALVVFAVSATCRAEQITEGEAVSLASKCASTILGKQFVFKMRRTLTPSRETTEFRNKARRQMFDILISRVDPADPLGPQNIASFKEQQANVGKTPATSTEYDFTVKAVFVSLTKWKITETEHLPDDEILIEYLGDGKGGYYTIEHKMSGVTIDEDPRYILSESIDGLIACAVIGDLPNLKAGASAVVKRGSNNVEITYQNDRFGTSRTVGIDSNSFNCKYIDDSPVKTVRADAKGHVISKICSGSGWVEETEDWTLESEEPIKDLSESDFIFHLPEDFSVTVRKANGEFTWLTPAQAAGKSFNFK